MNNLFETQLDRLPNNRPKTLLWISYKKDIFHIKSENKIFVENKKGRYQIEIASNGQIIVYKEEIIYSSSGWEDIRDLFANKKSFYFKDGYLLNNRVIPNKDNLLYLSKPKMRINNNDFTRYCGKRR